MCARALQPPGSLYLNPFDNHEISVQVNTAQFFLSNVSVPKSLLVNRAFFFLAEEDDVLL